MASAPLPLRDFTFRAMLFDAECERFRKAGLRIGVPAEEAEQDLLRDSLSPFSLSVRAPALRMTRLYAILYCFENSVREMISARMVENEGATWWDKCVPANVKKHAESRRNAAEQNSWLEGESASLLHFVDFGHLSDIITNNWAKFEDLIPSQHWLKQRFDELEKARNFVAHHRMLKENEFSRIELYINDWSKQVGF